ncbi:hypothetical protein [Burkholderia sp. 3C]
MRTAPRQPSSRGGTDHPFSQSPRSFVDDVDSHEMHAARHLDDFDDSDNEPFVPARRSAVERNPQHAGSEAEAADYFSYAPPCAREASPSFLDTHHCPHCGSSRVETLNIGRKAGTTIGSVAGATSGVAMALSGAEAGATVGAIGGPIGAVFGGLTGAVLAGLLGSAAGSVAGSTIGGALDDNFLDNYRCLSCGQSFGAQYH